MRSTTALLMLAVFGVANTRCSFIFTKGPQPEVQPPPPCTTGNAAPALDICQSATANPDLSHARSQRWS